MQHITIEQYLAPHVPTYGRLLSLEDRRRAEIVVDCANILVQRARAGGIVLVPHPTRGTGIVSSGWRPAAYNATVGGAAPNSKHITCQAIDIYDPDGDLDEWLMGDGQQTLIDVGLWAEHPAATKGWTHVQTIPPKSGRRFFYP